MPAWGATKVLCAGTQPPPMFSTTVSNAPVNEAVVHMTSKIICNRTRQSHTFAVYSKVKQCFQSKYSSLQALELACLPVAT
jgi:hypothetical protein